MGASGGGALLPLLHPHRRGHRARAASWQLVVYASVLHAIPGPGLRRLHELHLGKMSGLASARQIEDAALHK